MTNRKRALLQLPQGAESFYLEDAFRHRRLIERIEQVVDTWGYLPVQTPVFDFFGVYEDLIPSREARSIYRLIDREGDVLMLRYDNTLFLAKQMGLMLSDDDLPVRVWYGDTILRHQEAEDISNDEFFQTGVELIGKRGRDADLEVLVLLDRVFSALGAPSRVVHLGSRALLQTIAPGDAPEAARAFRRAIALRRHDDVRALCRENGCPPDRSRFLAELFAFIGTRDELEQLIRRAEHSRLLTTAETGELRYIELLSKEYEELDLNAELRIDLSEVGSQPYHTGIVFNVYMEGIGAAIASGGRYDNLISHFGMDAPAVGFSILLRKVQEHLTTNISVQDARRQVQVGGESFRERLEQAERIRARGEVVLL